MIVKNDIVFFNKVEASSLSIGAEAPHVSIKFLNKRNIILLSPINGIVLKKYKNTEFFYTYNIWCFDNNTIWRMKKINKKGLFTGEYSLLSPQFKFRVSRSESFKKISNTNYNGVFFKSCRLNIDDLMVNFRNNIYFRVNTIKSFFENKILTVTILDNSMVINNISYNKKVEIDSNINSIAKCDDSIFYKSQLLRSAQNYYGNLSDYKYVATEQDETNETLIFRKE